MEETFAQGGDGWRSIVIIEYAEDLIGSVELLTWRRLGPRGHGVRERQLSLFPRQQCGAKEKPQTS